MERMDWTHQWENFEMFMYVVGPEEGTPGIFMQVSRRELQDRAEQWDILYDRRIAPLEDSDLRTDDVGESAVPAPPGSEVWEERILRRHLQRYPDLVNEEKVYLQDFIKQS